MLFTGCSYIQGYDEEISFEQLPDNIRLLVEEEINAGQIVEIEKEVELFRTTYSIEYVVGEEEWELEYRSDGTLILHEID